MKHLLACILIVFTATACNAAVSAPPPGTQIVPSVTRSSSISTIPPQTATPIASSSAELPSPTGFSTPIPCDPAENYCIEAGFFFLDRPITSPGTDTIDRGYPYGSTDGGKREPHHGVEFYNASGTPVQAAADGLVVSAGDDSLALIGPRLNFYGKVIVLEHHFPGVPRPVYTLYGHLSKVEATNGQTVLRGEKIGEAGASGEAIGSHLHFEVRVGLNDYDSTRNPVLWLKPLIEKAPAPHGVIAGRVLDAGGKTLQTTNINIQYFPDTIQPQAAAFQVDTYVLVSQAAKGDGLWNENFTLSDIPAGNYRISLLWGSTLYERWVAVLPGKLTFVIFQLDR
jgi:murein DD-endopeptidase MepM/ murein hydrolase activator NlpD